MKRSQTDSSTTSRSRRVGRLAASALAVLGSVGAVGAVAIGATATPAGAAYAQLYVNPATGADAGNCGNQVSPCATIAYAETQLGSNNIINLTGTSTEQLDVTATTTIQQWQGQPAASISPTSDPTNTPVITVEPGVSLQLTELTISGGTAPNGGGIYNNGGNVSLYQTTVTNNTATSDPFYNGGGGIFSSGSLTLTHQSNITNNTTTNNGYGGGIDATGSLSITDSTISGNTSSNNGGGIYSVQNTTTISRTSVTSNTADSNGGGLFFSNGTVTLSNDDISNNSAGTGAGIFDDSDTTISDSSLVGNTAAYNGGGLYSNAGALSFSNSTVASNSASYGGGGVEADAGMTATSSTFWGNTNLYNGGANIGAANNSDHPVTLAADLIGSHPVGVTNCAIGSVVDSGYNIDDDGSCWLSGTGSVSNATGLDAYVSAPAFHAGSITQTAALGVGSQATAVVPSSFAGVCAAPDQNGTTRGTPCDMGAYEVTLPAAPTILSSSATQFSEGVAGSFAVVADQNPSLSESGALPSGVTFADNGGGSATLAGTPASGTGGRYPITITASNGISPDAVQNFVLTVTPVNFYVSSSGTDAGDCTNSANPCATVSYALTQVGSDTGDIVNVAGTVSDNVMVDAPVTIQQWAGQPAGTLDGGGDGSVVIANADLTINGLTITNGDVVGSGGGVAVMSGTTTLGGDTITKNRGFDNGGGIYVNPGATASLNNTTVSNNTLYGIFPDGGGIYNDGTLNITNSTVSANTIPRAGGHGVGIYNGGQATVLNSTISGNSSTANGSYGGGFFNGDVAVIDSSTITGNQLGPMDSANGVGVWGGVSTSLSGDILANQLGGSCGGSEILDYGYNIDDDGSCGLTATGSVSGSSTIDASLGELANNGGPTQTVALAAGSPAVGVIPSDFTAPGQPQPLCSSPDQRGVTRATPCDMGAFALSAQTAPTITSADHVTFTVGVAGSFLVTTTGSPVPALSETDSGLPSGVTFVDNGDGTATISGTPDAGAGGSVPITITASNGVSPDATQNFTLVVNEAPAITSDPGSTFDVGTSSDFQVTTNGYPTNSISETGALPAGLTFVDNGDSTADISGTPAAGTAGVYNLVLTASNSSGPDATQDFTLTVNGAPAITSASGAYFDVGSSHSFTITTSGFPVPAVGLSGVLPTGLSFVDNGDGTATISGTPAANTGGQYPVTVTATSSVSPPATQTLHVIVYQVAAITSPNTATFHSGVAGSFQVTAGGYPVPNRFATTSTLPTGLTLSPTGLLSGTTTQVGTFSVDVTASIVPSVVVNGHGAKPFGEGPAHQVLTLTVAAAPAANSVGGSSVATTPDGKGYWIVSAKGVLHAFGTAGNYGSTAGFTLNAPIVGITATPDGKGYWEVASDGGVFNFGNAGFYGSTGGIHLNQPMVGIAATPDGHGYWLVAQDGGIFAFGDAQYLGSTGGIQLNQPIVGIGSSPSGHGYWLVASDGGVFSFGDAGFHGSLGGVHLNKPVVGIAGSADGGGYWMVASDGGIFSFGDARFDGSPVGRPGADSTIGIFTHASGYTVVNANGQLFNFTPPAG